MRHHVEERLTDLATRHTFTQYAGQTEVPEAVWRTLEWAAYLELELTPDTWFQVAQLAARWPNNPFMNWLQKSWNPSWTASLDVLLNSLPGADKAAAAEVLPTPWPHAFISAVLNNAHSDELTPLQQQQITRVIQQANSDTQARAWLENDPPAWSLPLAVEVGNCQAERRLLEELAANPTSGPRWPLRDHAMWLANVRCPSSTDALIQALRAALQANRDVPDLDPLYRALNRCAGLETLAIYDQLMNDPGIPHARFLYYQRQTALNALTEATVNSTALENPSIDDMIIRLTPHESQR